MKTKKTCSNCGRVKCKYRGLDKEFGVRNRCSDWSPKSTKGTIGSDRALSVPQSKEVAVLSANNPSPTAAPKSDCETCGRDCGGIGAKNCSGWSPKPSKTNRNFNTKEFKEKEMLGQTARSREAEKNLPTKTRLWFEGVPHSEIIFTEDDLKVVLILLDERRDRENKNEYSRVFNRIMIQRLNHD